MLGGNLNAVSEEGLTSRRVAYLIFAKRMGQDNFDPIALHRKTTMENVEAGQFDDAPEDQRSDPGAQTQTQLWDARGDGAYIDTHHENNEEAWQYENEDDEDEDYASELEDTFEFDRVEDEDWEQAERGM